MEVTQDFLSFPVTHKHPPHSPIHILARDGDIRHVKINLSLEELSQHILKSSLLKAKPLTGASQHPPGQQNKPAVTASSVQHKPF